MTTTTVSRPLLATGSRPIDWIAIGVATSGGLGLIGPGPGTWGSLGGVALLYWSAPLKDHHFTLWILGWLCLCVLGTWSSKTVCKLSQSSDHQSIVIDEVTGMWISGCLANGWKEMLISFLFFRFFDILKPPPIRQIDLWSKRQSHPWLQGLGVMLDDWIAGLCVLFCIIAMRYFYG